MILELDCGNRRLKWRLLDAATRLAAGSEMRGAGVAALETLAAGRGAEIKRARMVSVASDEDTRQLCEAVARLWGVEVELAAVAAAADGVSCAYTEPSRLGADRWLAMLAARRAAAGAAAIIVDAGTSLTVDFVSSSGRHLGGYIAPGYHLLVEALCAGAAGIELEAPPPATEFWPGRDTIAAVTAGAALMLEGLIVQARRRAGEMEPEIDAARLFVTGGDGEWLCERLPEAIWSPELVLDGLVCVLP